MSVLETIDRLTAELRAEAEAAYARGYADGQAALADAVQNAVDGAMRAKQSTSNLVAALSANVDARMRLTETLGGPDGHAQALEEDREAGDGGKRAPRGLMDGALDYVLAHTPGMTIKEVEAAVVAFEPRVAVKSVYNRLRFLEKQGERFRRVDQKWFRIEDYERLTSQGSSKGETGSREAPRPISHFTLSGGAAPTVPEAGGT